MDVVAPAKRPWTSYMPVPLALESEAAVFVGQEAMTLVTLYDGRVRTDTPLDLPEAMAFDRLTDQVRSVAAMMIRAGNDPGFFRETQLRLMDRGHRPLRANSLVRPGRGLRDSQGAGSGRAGDVQAAGTGQPGRRPDADGHAGHHRSYI